MKIGLLPVGQVDRDFLDFICEGLPKIYADTTCNLIGKQMPLPSESLDKKRCQYEANSILGQIQLYADLHETCQRVLGVTEADLYVFNLNYIFGLAFTPGNAGLISLFRLKPEVYGEPSNRQLVLDRALKEAVHELGHTLGLRHCATATCVMHFSNLITDTDKKQSFCNQCSIQEETAIKNLG